MISRASKNAHVSILCSQQYDVGIEHSSNNFTLIKFGKRHQPSGFRIVQCLEIESIWTWLPQGLGLRQFLSCESTSRNYHTLTPVFRVFGMDLDVCWDFKLRSNIIVCFKNFSIWNSAFHDPILPQHLQCRVHTIAYSNFSQECQVSYKYPDSSVQTLHHSSCHLANQRETWRLKIYTPLHENQKTFS